MLYDRCPRCELNYKKKTDKYCQVCMDEMAHKENDFDENEFICPLCYKNKIGYDEVICKKCQQKRQKMLFDEDNGNQ